MMTTFRKLATAFTLVLVPLIMSLCACNGKRLSALPPQLLGDWTTTDARYHGRSMNLAANQVTFGMGGTGSDRPERVEGVRLITAENNEEYNIALRTPENSSDRLILEFEAGHGGEIHLKSQPRIIWTRAKASSTSSSVPAESAGAAAHAHSASGASAGPGASASSAASARSGGSGSSHALDDNADIPSITPQLMNDHKTIYKIDCIRPNICKSY
jgi:hypothetical protein